MRSTTLLTLLTSALGASGASLPARPRATPRLLLLHTFSESSPSNARLLAASTESTKGGAILTLGDDGNSPAISSVQGTFRVPHAEIPTSGPTAGNPVGEYAASFWVGIDSARPRPASSPNATCGGSLRAGVDVFWDGTIGGQQSPFAWYQFAPGMGNAVGFGEGFSVSPGDLVRFTLDAGSVLVENFGGNVTCVSGGANNGTRPIKSVRQALPSPSAGLCGTEAAFIVDDPPLVSRPDVPVALANFTSVTFGTRVTLADGSVKDLAGAEVLDVRQQQQGGKLTSCEVVEGKKVKCTRVVDS
ncbi:concanavalin A-like lectin/glucanase domain-containing protein [Chaetomium strumarium]|uniref:Concanavalin A-like lectin/glucanase domain-containing protein n=1 Tax=Chaetomium strumarium TaxID=1170767 RepID=A0AAJ0M4I0_9PEZI|nr:concanavalin A-like lectin/glucanase domain-containing protein [Chaetomium strumarium]